MKHVMVDLETMGTRAGAAIASIGAVKFDPENGLLDSANTFYQNIDLKSCQQAGLYFEASTVYWWLQQSVEARTALAENLVPLTIALVQFSKFFEGAEFVWAHGVSFDIPILETAYLMTNIPVPWSFKNVRDTRTLFDISGDKCRPSEVPHHALSDAIAQALTVMQSYDRIREWT